MSVSNTGNGYGALTATNDVTGLVFKGNEAFKNFQSGLRIRSSGTGKFLDLAVSDNFLFQNGQAGGTSVNNLRIDASTTGASIKNNDLGTPTAIPSNGLSFTTGKTQTDMTVQGNDVRGSATKWTIAGTFTGCRFINNPGYNWTDPAAVPVTASPFTHTAGPRPEVLHLIGGTITDITKACVSIGNGTGRQITLGPNQAVTITYSAAPTLVREHA